MDAVVSIGENVQINDYVHIAAINNVIIGRDTLIASKVFISDHNHGIFSKSDIHSSPTIIPSSRPLESACVYWRACVDWRKCDNITRCVYR